MTPSRVLETCLYATDLEAAERFYGDVIGLPIYSHQDGRDVFFRCGEAMLLIFNPEKTSGPETPYGGGVIPRHGARGAGHVAFAVDEADLDAWRDRLRDNGIAIESEVTWPNGARSIYFRDPADNCVELAVPRMWGIGG